MDQTRKPRTAEELRLSLAGKPIREPAPHCPTCGLPMRVGKVINNRRYCYCRSEDCPQPGIQVRLRRYS